MSAPLNAETELKLRPIGAEGRDAAAALVGEAPARPLESVYFDAPGGRVRRSGYALRVRRDGERFVQTVKGPPRAGQSRYEHEVEVPSEEVRREVLEGTPLAEVLADHDRLAPVFRTRVTRRSAVREVGGASIEISLDEGEVVTADRRAPIYELELELKAGPVEALFAEARRLAEAAPLHLEMITKAERGYRLAAGDAAEPLRWRAPELAPAETVAEALQAAFRAGLRQLTENAALFGEAARPEAVHQARVGLRRLRVALSAFRPALGEHERDALDAELAWAATELGRARDLDVFAAELLHPRLAKAGDRAAYAALGEATAAARSAAYARCREALASPRFRVLLVDAARFAEAGGWIEDPLTAAAAAAALGPFACEALDRRLKTLRRRLRRLDWRDAHAVHRLRIAAKKMRYASDAFEALAADASALSEFLDALKGLQDRLGRINDLRVAPQTALSAASGLEDRDRALSAAFAAGDLAAHAGRSRQKLLRKARREAEAFVAGTPWWRAG